MVLFCYLPDWEGCVIKTNSHQYILLSPFSPDPGLHVEGLPVEDPEGKALHLKVGGCNSSFHSSCTQGAVEISLQHFYMLIMFLIGPAHPSIQKRRRRRSMTSIFLFFSCQTP
jgi:hypothetical protein